MMACYILWRPRFMHGNTCDFCGRPRGCYRGYYVAAWRYEISLRVSRREISSLQAAIYFSIYYIHTNEIQNHFTSIVFWCERRDLLWSHSNRGDIFTCEDNMLFSHVKILSFRAKDHLVFHWCFYNKIIYFSNKYIISMAIWQRQ